MKSKTKIFNIILALLLTLSVVTFNSEKIYAEESGTYDNVDWRITDSGELIIGREGVTQEFTYRDSRLRTDYPWYSRENSINSVRFVGTVKGNGNMIYMFHGSRATTLDLSNFDTSNVTNMSFMFFNSQATTLDLSNFDTSNVTSMDNMFAGSQATTLDLSSFDTSNVTNMWGMFYGSHATTLELSSFNTSNVTTMNSMFAQSQATSLDLSTFNTSKVTSMDRMFLGCTSLTTLDLSSFDTSNVTGMSWMFSRSQATSLNLSSFDTSKVTNMSGMFYQSQATSLDLSSFNTSKVTNMEYMFSESQATTLDLSNFDTSNVTNMGNMFENSKATSINLSSFNTLKINTSSAEESGDPAGMIDMFLNSDATLIVFSNNMLGDNGERFKVSNLSGSDWVRVRDKNGNLTYDDTQFTGEQVRNLTESTTPKLSGTWVKKSSPEYQAEIDKGQEYISKQGVNALNNWVRNGNVWTYTFDVFDDSIPYYIWEDIIPGYKSSVMKPRRDYFNESGEKYYEITNVSTDRASLEISKVVEGIETDQKFNVTIKINDWPGTFVKSGIVFTDGVANIKLGHGETKLIEGLPSNKTFIVSEQEVSPFVSSSTGESGTLSKGQKSEVTFTNTWVDPKIETPENFDNVTIKKLIDGKYETSGKYTFYISLTNLAANTTYELSNGETFISDASGNANVNVELEANEELVIKYLPVGSYYQITEQAGDYTSAYVITGSENLNANQSTGNSTGEQQQLSTALERVDSNEEAVVTFTNTLTKSESIKVKKLVNGTEADKLESFNFVLTMDNLEPYGKYDTSIGRFVADEDGWLQKEFSLKDNEEVVIENLPIGATYQVTEKKNHLAASYSIEDANGLDLINLTDNQNEEKSKDLSTAVETVNEGEDVTITFTNTRNTVLITLKKIVDGNMGNKNDVFNFTVQINDRQPVSYQLSHDEQIEIEIPLNAQYTISEQDYSSEGYRTYVNNKLFQTRVFEDTATEDKDVTFKNIKGAIVPTGISLYLQTGIPIIILISILFLLRKKIRAFL